MVPVVVVPSVVVDVTVGVEGVAVVVVVDTGVVVGSMQSSPT